MIRRWANVEGYVSATIQAPDTDWGWADEHEDEFYLELQTVLTELFPDAGYYDSHEYRLDIYFLSTGYDDPGNTFGPPEGCYPPESEDERTVMAVSVWQDNTEQALPEDTHPLIYNWYESSICNAVVDTNAEEWDNEGQ